MRLGPKLSSMSLSTLDTDFDNRSRGCIRRGWSRGDSIDAVAVSVVPTGIIRLSEVGVDEELGARCDACCHRDDCEECDPWYPGGVRADTGDVSADARLWTALGVSVRPMGDPR